MTTSIPSIPNPSGRLPGLDALRGLAMLWMAAFHLCFDLQFMGWLQANFYQDPFWTVQRSCIVSLFLFCAGLGQALAHSHHVPWSRFWRRWCQIAGAALLVTLGSWWVFPESFIYFGVLHGMAVMLPLTRWLGGRWSWRGCLLVSAVVLALPALARWAHGVFPELAWLNEPLWNALGLISHKPRTEDYVPLAPWWGVMLLGYSLGRRWLVRPMTRVSTPLPQVLRPLVWLGQHSLVFYLVHQPVLLGGLMLWRFV